LGESLRTIKEDNVNKLTGWIVGLAGVVVITAALALAMPAQPPAPGVSRPAGPVAPEGCRPVAPGSYTFVCENPGLPTTEPTPVMPKAPAGCRPIAPGSYTFVCEDTGTTVPVDHPEPIAQLVCRPAAPGAYTSICLRP
jgi:hypothetical protein